ncbi:MAG: GGDEF domain-containing protein [Gammaproteobacteria bacterium]|nr:GGDEF domain-containing protein [Gammaproteobacteria bacterium]
MDAVSPENLVSFARWLTTKIANRRSYKNRLAYEIASAKRNENSLAQLMIDIDYFKAYNDRYGHDSGDMTLSRVAEAIDNSLPRKTDFSARFGGEEFVVLLPDTQEKNAYNIAERIRLNIKALGINHEGSEVTGIVTLSIGIASLSGKSLNKNDLLKNADAALYQAKHSGRNCCKIFTPKQR